MEFPPRLHIDMVENGYIASERDTHGLYGKSWVFRTASELGSWLRDNAPSYGLGGNAPPYLPEVK